jgi:hypothetical protein
MRGSDIAKFMIFAEILKLEKSTLAHNYCRNEIGFIIFLNCMLKKIFSKISKYG